MPTSIAPSRFWATAPIARPIRVLCRNAHSAASTASEIGSSKSSTVSTRTPRISWLPRTRAGTPVLVTPNRSFMICSTKSAAASETTIT